MIWSRGENLSRLKPPRLPDLSDVIAAIEHRASSSERRAPDIARYHFTPAAAKRFYDRFGTWQDAQFYEREALEHMVAHSDFEHASAAFEWGCGTGKLAERLFRKHLASDASYIGIDISTTMVEIATRRLANWNGRVTVRHADGTIKLPYGDSSFDRFIATYVLDLLSESAIHNVLSEAHRLLRTNGKLCIVSLTEGITPVSRVLTSVWKRIYTLDPRLVGGCRPLHLTALLDGALWKTEHTHVVCSWGICSEVVIAYKAP